MGLSQPPFHDTGPLSDASPTTPASNLMFNIYKFFKKALPVTVSYVSYIRIYENFNNKNIRYKIVHVVCLEVGLPSSNRREGAGTSGAASKFFYPGGT
jgi:hypothetical protein